MSTRVFKDISNVENAGLLTSERAKQEFAVCDGYLGFFMPDHPLARQNGMVMVHRHNASIKEGRWLTDEDIVVFRDQDRANLKPENLLITDRAGSASFSAALKRIWTTCKVCTMPFADCPSHIERRHTCSVECRIKSRTTPGKPSKIELAELVWEKSTVQIAADFGVSDSAVGKWCKKWGIEKPPPGYWAKVYAGKDVSHIHAPG